MKPRTSLAIQRDVIIAIYLREMKTRFSGFILGNFWMVVEPLIFISIFIMLFGLRGRGEFGYAEPAVFITAGVLPFKTLWQFTMSKTKSAWSKAKSLAMFRQISLFDIFLTTALVEFSLFLVVGLLIVILLVWLGFDAVPKNFLPVIGYGFLLWLMAFSVGVSAAMISRFAKEIQTFLGMLSMPALFLSAVFFPMTAVPEPYRTTLAYNPLVHPMEFIREAWLGSYESPVADDYYLGAWVLCLMAFAMSQYSLNWRRLMSQ